MFYRLDLTEEEFFQLKECIKLQLNNGTETNKLREKIEKPKEIKYSKKKIQATKKATNERIKKVKEKIQNAINILRMEQKKITHYSVAQMAEVSFLTVKKYLDIETVETLNKSID